MINARLNARRSIAAITLALTIVGLAAAQTPAIDATVAIVDFAFQPATITVGLNSTLQWANHGLAPHTVTFRDGSADSSVLNRGETYSRAFAVPGSYSYFCAIHENMTGTITVLDVPLEPVVWIPLIINELPADEPDVE